MLQARIMMIRLFPVIAVFQICGCHASGGIKASLSNAGTGSGVIQQGSGGSGSSSIVVGGDLDLQIDPPNGNRFEVGTGTITGGTISGGTLNVVRGIECGSKVQMYPGNTVQVFSSNFGIAHYRNNEACTWRFQANQCTLSAYCPCADIPKSYECLGDYLKVSTDYILEKQRFCGGNKPGQPIYSNTDFLSIRFRSDGKNTAAGFTCFVRCEGPGVNTMPIDSNIKCPTSASLRGYRSSE